MSGAGVRINCQRLPNGGFGSGEILLSQQELAERHVKGRRVLCLRTELFQSLQHLVNGLRRHRRVSQHLQRFGVRRLFLQNVIHFFARPLQVPIREMQQGQFYADVQIVGFQFLGFGQEGVGFDELAVGLIDQAQMGDALGVLPQIQVQHIQVFQLRLVVLAVGKILVRPLQMPGHLRLAGTTDAGDQPACKRQDQ